MLRCSFRKAFALLLGAVFIVSMMPVMAGLSANDSSHNINVKLSLTNESFPLSHSGLVSTIAHHSQMNENRTGGNNLSSQISDTEGIIDNKSFQDTWNRSNISAGATAQGSNDLEWQKCLGGSGDDKGYSIQQTADGGYIVAGSTTSNDGNVSGNNGLTDAWVVKLDSNKAMQWQKCLGMSNYNAFANSIRQTSDGGYIVAGYVQDLSYYNSQCQSWVVKLSSSGILQWQKIGPAWLANSIQQTADGGYIVAGESLSHSARGNTLFFDVAKLTSDGAIQWEKNLGGSYNGGLGDWAQSVQQTTDGGYIVAGTTRSNDGNVSGNHGGEDFWVVKLDSSGALTWQKCLGGSNDDAAYSIQQTSDGGYIVAGSTYSNDGDVSLNHGGSDYWLVKLDSSGVKQWQKCLGGSGSDVANSIQQTSDGGYIVAGYAGSNDGYASYNHGSNDFLIIKLDPQGVPEWNKCLGGSGDDEANSIQQTSDGGYIVAGFTNSNNDDVSGNHGNYDFWVAKIKPQTTPTSPSQPLGPASGLPGGSYPYSTSATDPNGDRLTYTFDWGDGSSPSQIGPVNSGLTASASHSWSNTGIYRVKAKVTNSSGISSEWSDTLTVTISTSNPPLNKCLGGSGDDKGYSIQQTADGGYIVAGSTTSNDGNVSGNNGLTDAWVVKLDSNKAMQWQKCLGMSNYNAFANSIRQTSDGGYIVAGYVQDLSYYNSQCQSWVVKLSSSGILQWQKIGPAWLANSIQQTADGGYIVAGESLSHSARGNTLFFDVAKLTSDGAIQWEKNLGGSYNGGLGDWAQSVQQTTDGGYIVAGTTRSNDGNVSGNHGGEDFWVVKLDSNGALTWQKCLGGSNDDAAYSIQQTSDGGYIVAGSTYSNDGDVSLNHGGSDYWLVKLDSSGVKQWQKCLGGSGSDVANSIQQTSDGGYIVAGYAGSNDGYASYNHGSNDFLIIKLDPQGVPEWNKCLGGSGDDEANSIQQTSDGGYIVAGFTNSNNDDVSGNHGNYDFWVAKIKPQTTPTSPSQPLGPASGLPGGSYPYSTSATDPNGDRLTYTFDWGDGSSPSQIGPVNSGLTASASHSWSNTGIYRVKAKVTNSSGISSEWSDTLTVTISTSNPPLNKCLGGSGDDKGYSIQQTADGGYIVAGSTTSNDGNVSGNNGLTDAWVVKLDSNKAMQWQKCLGMSNYNAFANSIRQTSDGGYIVAGYVQDLSYYNSQCQSWVVKLSSSGILQWQKIGPAWLANSIQQTADGGYIVAGESLSHSARGNTLFFDVAKLTSDGAIQWEKNLGGSYNGGLGDWAQSVQQTTDGGYIVAGTTRSNDGNVSGNHGGEDFWVVKLDSNGALTWQKCLGGSNDDAAYSIQQTSDGGYIVAGSTYSNDGDVSLNHGGSDYWLVKLDSSGVKQWQKCLGGSGSDVANSIQQTSDGGYIVAGYAGSKDGDASDDHLDANGNPTIDILVTKLDSQGVLEWNKCLGGSGDDEAYGVQQTSDGGYIVAGYTNSNGGDVKGNHGNYDFWVAKIKPEIGSGPIAMEFSIKDNKNTLSPTEQVPIEVKVSRNSLPAAAVIALKINGQAVAGCYGSGLTYQFGPCPVGSYNIEATAATAGLQEMQPGKIEVTGDISKALSLADNLKSVSFSEIDQSENNAAERLVEAEIDAGKLLVNQFIDKVLGKFGSNMLYSKYPNLKNQFGLIIKSLGEMISAPLDYCIQKAIENIVPANVISEAETKQINILEKLSNSIILNKNLVNYDYSNFVKFIKSHPQKFASRPNLNNFFNVWTQLIQNIYETYDVITPSIEPFTLPTEISTEGNLAQTYDEYNYAYGNVSDATLWLVGALFVLFIAGLVVGSAGIGAFALLFGSALTQATTCTDIFSSCFKILLALCMMMMTPSVINEIATQHYNGIQELEQEFGTGISHETLHVNATNTVLGNTSLINSNGLSFVMTPDGRITKFLKSSGDYMGFRSGKYSVFAYQPGYSLFSYVKSTSFQISKPNVTLNVSYTLQGNAATVYLSLENHGLTRIGNITSLFDIENTSNAVSFSKVEFLSLDPGEIKNITYPVNLVDPDIYTASASLSMGFLSELEEKKIVIPFGVISAEDASILAVDYKDEYSPHNNIAMNVTLQSYAPVFAFNVSIPRFNSIKPVVVTGKQVVNITLPKLKPDYYVARIVAEKLGKVLDSKLISFYVQADGVGLLTFNTSQIIYTAGKSAAINLSLKDLNLTNVNAQVGVTVSDPSGYKQDYPATETSDGYQFNFMPATNGTYMLEIHASKEGWRIENNTFTVIVGQMSPLKMNVTVGDYIVANVTANGQPAACNVTMYTPQGAKSTITSNGLALFNATDQFYIVADKMFFEPAYFSFEPYKLYYPDLTDTADSNGLRSAMVLQNPSNNSAAINLTVLSRDSTKLYSGSSTIPAHGTSSLRPRDLVGTDCAGSAIITSDLPIKGICQLTRNDNQISTIYNAFNHSNTTLYYPDFTDAKDPNSWRSSLVLQNPGPNQASLNLEIRSRAGGLLYSGGMAIPAYGMSTIKPRDLAGFDLTGSATITSDWPITGTCEITRNDNQESMIYNAFDQGNKTLYYPDFTDTADKNSWKSLLILQNPSSVAASVTLNVRSRSGRILFSGIRTIPANGVNTFSPRDLVGSDCSGSVVVTSDQPIMGIAQMARNDNSICTSYNAFDQCSGTLYYPDFTDTSDPTSWSSFLVIQNSAGSIANINLKILSRSADLLYSGNLTIPAHGSSAIRPVDLVGANCEGSAVVKSDSAITGTCQIIKNDNQDCTEYKAVG